MASRAKTKTTARPRLTKVKRTPKAAPLTEAKDRVLKAVDVTRVLYEHKDAKLIGRRNRDEGFGILLAHLDAAYKALHRYSNRDAHGAVNPAFSAAHKRWLKAQAGWTALNGESTENQAAFDRLTDKRSTTRERSTERLAAIPAQDVGQIAQKADALWDMLLCDFKGEAEAIGMGALDAETFALIKSIRRDATRLARGRAS